LHTAVRHSDGKYVCVKRPLLSGEQLSSRLLEMELSILRSIDHPNILQAIEIVVDGPSMSLVTEHIPGSSLHQLVVDAPACRLDENLARSVCIKLFQAVAYLHSKQICHRDINPHKVRVSHDCENLKLTDFDRASRFDTTKNLPDLRRHHTTENSPEQKFAEASDVWGGGACLHFMLSGQRPCIGSRDASASDLDLCGDVWRTVSSSCIEFLDLSLKTECNQRPAASDLLQLQWVDVNAIQ